VATAGTLFASRTDLDRIGFRRDFVEPAVGVADDHLGVLVIEAARDRVSARLGAVATEVPIDERKQHDVC
jgi:hypothetical protein